MNNPFWDAMVRTRANAYVAGSAMGLDRCESEPVWCFDRFGQSLTWLPDGRCIEVAGEHDDYYDPDFCIYNDVVVHHGNGSFDLYGYPEEIFPPTDFHSATLVGEDVYIIGSLGYEHSRVPGFTPVFRLSTKSFKIEPVDCRGDFPGWIYKHKAKWIDGEIEIRGGKLIQEGASDTNDHIFRLNPATRTWRIV